VLRLRAGAKSSKPRTARINPGRFAFRGSLLATDAAAQYAIDFAALFVLFRDAFSFLPWRIFSSFRQSFCKTCVFYHTDDKRIGATHKYGCTVGSFGPWGAVSPQL
jgi:hypothetical protein